MKSNLKVLGVALTAVFAMSAMAATAAQANLPEFTADSYPAHLTGEGIEGVNAFTMLGTEIKCNHDTLSGTLNSPGSNTLTVTPSFTACSNNRTVITNGCHFVFHLDTNSLSASHHDATVDMDLECEPGQALIWHAFTDPTHTVTTCTITFGSQTDLVGTPTVTAITAENDSTDSLVIQGTIESIDHQLHGPCAGGGTPTLTNGVFHFNFTIKAHDGDLEHNGLRMST